MISTQLWWYTARASGIVGWFLLAGGVLWGLALSTKASTTKPLKGRVRPNWMLDLHRFLGAAAVVFTGIHVVSLILDSTVHFGLAEVLVPLASAWNPTAVAFGIAAMYLLVAVQATSMLRKHLSKRTWRAVHFASFPLFIFSSVHGLTAGTDGSNPAFVVTVAATCAAVVAMTAWRIKRRSTPRQSAQLLSGFPALSEARTRRSTHHTERSSTMSTPPSSQPSTPAPRRKRPHPAKRTRRAVGVASVAGVLVIGGTMATAATESASSVTTSTASTAATASTDATDTSSTNSSTAAATPASNVQSSSHSTSSGS